MKEEEGADAASTSEEWKVEGERGGRDACRSSNNP